MRQKQIDFVKAIYPAAKRLYDSKPGEAVHPIFETAQAALEKGWNLGDPAGHNLFGITKGTSWTGPVKLLLTTEYFATPDKKFKDPERVVSVTPDGSKYKYRVYRLFRQYRSMEDCLHDHQAIFRKSGYADAWPYRNNPKEFARRLMDGTGWKYATADNYVTVIHSIIDSVQKIVDQQFL